MDQMEKGLAKEAFAGVSLALIAGGKSSRMGFDKQGLSRGEKLLVHELLEFVRPYFAEIIVVTRTPQLYFGKNILLTEDKLPSRGPLSGIHAALEVAQFDLVYALACDMPNFSLHYAAALIARYRAESGRKELSAEVWSRQQFDIITSVGIRDKEQSVQDLPVVAVSQAGVAGAEFEQSESVPIVGAKEQKMMLALPAGIAVKHRIRGKNGEFVERAEAFHALYHHSLLPKIKSAVLADKVVVNSFMTESDFVYVDDIFLEERAEGKDIFLNLNDKGQARAAGLSPTALNLG